MVRSKTLFLKTMLQAGRYLPGCTILILSVLLFFPSPGVHAAERDTVLNAVYSEPFFYNVLADKKGSIFAGTSEGIFQLQGTKLIPYKKEPGYITLSKTGELVISTDGISNYYERKYLYLLPFPELARDEYHAGTEDHFYLCSGGRIYIYKIVPYSYSYAHHSIRTISENYVGTYSGIYYKGKRLAPPAPRFTDGYIREINGITYLCYDALLTIDPAKVQLTISDSTVQGIPATNDTFGVQFRDVYQSKGNGQFYFSSVTDLLKMEKGGVPVSIYTSSKKISEIVLVGEYKSILYFSDGNYLLKSRIIDDKIDTLATLPAEIYDGTVTERNIYLLTPEGLYQLNTNNDVQKLTPLSQAHSMELISATEMVIATNNGLFRFNTANKVLTPLIRGVEFNRKALFKKGDLLQAGSINGLYTINVNDLELLAAKNKSLAEKQPLPAYIIILLLLALALIAVLAVLLLRARRNLELTAVQLKELNVDVLSREKIEQYISENLATASLKSITDHFNTNNSHIYKLIEPDKPGSIIQKMRLEKLIELQKEGKEIEAIAEATGLSVSYLKKIRNKLEN